MNVRFDQPLPCSRPIMPRDMQIEVTHNSALWADKTTLYVGKTRPVLRVARCLKSEH